MLHWLVLTGQVHIHTHLYTSTPVHLYLHQVGEVASMTEELRECVDLLVQLWEDERGLHGEGLVLQGEVCLGAQLFIAFKLRLQ